MSWVSFPTLTDGQVLTGAHMQMIQGNFAETAPAKATAATQFFVATNTNTIAARQPTAASNSGTSTTTGTSYGDLVAGAGPTTGAVTTGEKALVMANARLTTSTGSAEAYAGFAISGATTLAADDSLSIMAQPDTGGRFIRAGMTTLVVGITPGSNTFTMKYRVSAGTGTFLARHMAVVPF